MPRGQRAADGETMVSQNGYHYTKVNGVWKLTHHITAEKKLGRPLHDEERVMFIGSKKNYDDPDNIRIIVKGKTSLHRRKAQLEARRDEIQAEIDRLEEEIAQSTSSVSS